ncbi:hypothetical protein Tsubulata_028539 [Turnera subulata]|uniref:Uncharacterized protein n=1 Tax=Turnera subulata TaxID=218843 RepID=A0A9Q0J758_9ROSI|nr:hypothetical protein Tsubulata_028539 [Turnera subulata]
MDKYWCFLNKEDMGRTVVCVKRVKQEESDEWDGSMPLPGDIIEGIAADDDEESFVSSPKAKAELSSELGKISQQAEAVWLRVRRGDSLLKLRARVVAEKWSMLHKKFTIKAANDDRHVAVLGDLTWDKCSELQEMSRKVVNSEGRGYSKKGAKYDWNLKVGSHLPDNRSSVVSSILFMPLQAEYTVEATTGRCMAWLSAAVSSGVPLIFVNIQTELTVNSEKAQCTGKEFCWAQQNHDATIHMLQGIRLWFLPGTSEICIDITPDPEEDRFGMDIKRTDEGFIYVHSVTKDSAADRAGMGKLRLEAKKIGYLLVVSRLEGKSVMPSSACCVGLIHCCDQNEIKDTLASAIEQGDSVKVHLMAWPSHTHDDKAIGAATLQPPKANNFSLQ